MLLPGRTLLIPGIALAIPTFELKLKHERNTRYQFIFDEDTLAQHFDNIIPLKRLTNNSINLFQSSQSSSYTIDTMSDYQLNLVLILNINHICNGHEIHQIFSWIYVS